MQKFGVLHIKLYLYIPYGVTFKRQDLPWKILAKSLRAGQFCGKSLWRPGDGTACK